jgi:hypothetical protein
MAKRHHGVVLTHVDDLDQLAECVRLGAYDTVKVVTRWGLDGGWTEDAMRRLLGMVPHVIVRTVAGDPSFDNHNPDFQFPHRHGVLPELQPWYDLRKDIVFEIGNEPNVDDHPSLDFIHTYRFFLNETIDECRKAFPLAKLISPGLLIGPTKDHELFNEIAGDVFRHCNYIGLHCYEHVSFSKKHRGRTTNQLREVLRFARERYGDMAWYVTEYGINKSDTQEKGRRYAGLAYYGESDPPLPDNVVGLTYYHLNTRGDIDPQYNMFPDGDRAFGDRVRAEPPGDIALPQRRANTIMRFAVIDPCSANPAENFASVRQAPRSDAIEAGRLAPGTPVAIDAIADGWAHLARENRVRDLGFVPLRLLRHIG